MSRRSAVVVVALLASSLAGVVASPVRAAAVINVPGDQPTIQAALSVAATGDRIRVSPGTYTGTVDFQGKDVVVESTSGPSTTVIDGNRTTGVIIGPGGELRGFTVRNAAASFGAGIEAHGLGSRIVGNVITGNAQGAGGYGAGIGGNVASPIIDGNLFTGNTCDGQFLSGVVSFINGSSPVIQNNLFVDNPCRGINLSLPEGNNPVVVNNTFVRNTVGIRVDRRVPSAGHEIRNNAITQNGIGLEVDFGSEANNPTFANNLVWANTANYDVITDQTGVAGNISADPQYVNATNDFHLAPTSPAIDAGSVADAPDHDFDGNARPVNLPDIGAYEAGSPLARISVLDASGNEGGTAQVVLALSWASSSAVTVVVSTANGTAVAPGDYTATSTQVTIAPNQLETSLPISLRSDQLDEATETFSVLLSAPSGAVIGMGAGVVSIGDTNPPPSLSVSSERITEGNADHDAFFRVSLSVPSGQTVQATLRVIHRTTTATDVVAGDIPVTISAGTISVAIPVRIKADLVNEATERFDVIIVQPVNATVAVGVGTGTILDDDKKR